MKIHVAELRTTSRPSFAFVEELTAKSSLQTEYLREINEFLKKNPTFIRGTNSSMLSRFYRSADIKRRKNVDKCKL